MKRDLFSLKSLFLLSYILSRVIILLSPGFLWDHTTYFPPIIELLNGQSPYLSSLSESPAYPPLFYFILACFVFIFGYNSLAFRVCFLTIDLGTVILLYKIATCFYEKREDYWKPPLFYALFPIPISILIIGLPTGIAILFFTAALYCLVKNKPFFMGVFAAIGFLIEIYPIFLLYVVCIIYFAQKQFKKILLALLGFIPVMLAIALPFFGFDLSSTLSLILVHLSRETSTSLVHFLPVVPITLLPDLSVNLYSLIAVFGIIALGIWVFVYAKRTEKLDLRKTFELLLFFFLFFPILFLNLYTRYLFWCMPVIGMLVNYSIDRRVLKTFLPSTLIIYGAFCIFLNVFLPNGLLLDLQSFPKLCSVDPPLLGYLIGLEIFLVSISVLWIRQWGKMLPKGTQRKSDSDLSISLARVMFVVLGFYWIEVPLYFYFKEYTIIVSISFLVLTCVALLLLVEVLFNFYSRKFSKTAHNREDIFLETGDTRHEPSS